MGFVEFLFETKKGKKIMGLLYGLGASVVIVGALFKIQHWPGAGPMLIIGLLTEAIIFAVSAFEPPHFDVDWTLVYPELAGMHDEDGGHGKKQIEAEDKGSITEQLDAMLEEAKIEPALIESLGQGLRKLGDNAGKLSEISNASVATEEYANSLKGASDKVKELSSTYVAASEALTGLSAASEAVSSTGEHLQKLSTNLRTLNESYEMQIKGAQEHFETTNKLYSGMSQLMANLNDSVDDTQKYKENIAELSTNLGKLNRIYGNMLTAMSTNA